MAYFVTFLTLLAYISAIVFVALFGVVVLFLEIFNLIRRIIK